MRRGSFGSLPCWPTASAHPLLTALVFARSVSAHHIWSERELITREMVRIIIITYVIPMQTVHIPSSAFYYYSSPVKSEPDTETDESEPTVLKPTHNLPTPNDHPRSKVKSSLCKNFALHGTCPYGRRCQFAHGPEELRCNENINTSYKTKPCFAFRKQGSCPYGHRCNFQHSDHSRTPAALASRILEHFPELVVELGGAQSRLVSRLNLPTTH